MTMTIKDQAREIIAAHYDAKGWTTRATAFREGKIECADDVDLVVGAIEAERGRIEQCVNTLIEMYEVSGKKSEASIAIRMALEHITAYRT